MYILHIYTHRERDIERYRQREMYTYTYIYICICRHTYTYTYICIQLNYAHVMRALRRHIKVITALAQRQDRHRLSGYIDILVVIILIVQIMNDTNINS